MTTAFYDAVVDHLRKMFAEGKVAFNPDGSVDETPFVDGYTFTSDVLLERPDLAARTLLVLTFREATTDATTSVEVDIGSIAERVLRQPLLRGSGSDAGDVAGYISELIAENLVTTRGEARTLRIR